jgi:prevent-host-death family protein
MKTWPVQDAKARFSALLDTCLKDGPQTVTRRGVEQAVLVPIAEWRRLTATPKRTLKALLLTDEARHDFEFPYREALALPEPPSFED